MRRTWKSLAVTWILTVFAGLTHAQTQDGDTVGLRAHRDYIAPSMQAFHQATQSLESGLKALCEAPGNAEAVLAVRRQFDVVLQQWAGISFLRFGPLVQANRFERIFFWPDPRGVMQRQISQLLASDDIPDASELAAHSVAVQGLPALEYVLYRKQGLLDDEVAATDDRQCRYARAVAGNLAGIARELDLAWRADAPYAREFVSPAPENTFYRNEDEVHAEMLKALSSGLRFEGEVKLKTAVGAKDVQAQLRALPFGRSLLATDVMSAALDGMFRFHEAAGFPGEPDWLRSSLAHELGYASVVLNPLRGWLRDETAFDVVQQELRLAQLVIDNARRMVDEDLAAALGVGLGFNALDGD